MFSNKSNGIEIGHHSPMHVEENPFTIDFWRMECNGMKDKQGIQL